MPALAPPAERASPTRWQSALFRLKTTAFRLRRTWHEAARERRTCGVWNATRINPEPAGPVLAESRTAALPERGRRRNSPCRRARCKTCVSRRRAWTAYGSGGREVFSFWRHVGRPTSRTRVRRRTRIARGLHRPEHRRRVVPALQRALRRRAGRRLRDRRTPCAFAAGARFGGRGRAGRDGVLELRRSAVPLRRWIAGWRSGSPGANWSSGCVRIGQ